MSTAAARASDASANRRGIVAMVAAMAAFTANDTLIKLTAPGLPLGEMITLRNTFASLLIAVVGVAMGGFQFPARPPIGLFALRMLGEVGSTLTFLAALVAMPIADAIAIAQFTPLALTAGAAIFLGEPVGWRRWLAAAIGLAGVLLIIRPGTSAFVPAGLWALGSLGFIVLRDLATRRISVGVPTPTLALMSAVSVGLSGFLLLPFETWVAPTTGETLSLALAAVFLLLGYIFIINAMRTGEIAAVSPFRYSVILWALLSGFLVWGQLPDAVSVVGILVVVGAGLFTFWREQVLRART